MKTAVKIGVSRQVAIPKKIYDDLGLEPGDYLSVQKESGGVFFKPQTLLDKRLAESIEDYRHGRYYGPFNSAKEMVAHLRKNKPLPSSK